MKSIFFVILLFLSSNLAALQESVRVVNIFENGTIETISPSGNRQRVRLQGLQPITFPNQIKSATVKRLKTLVLGKTVQLTTVQQQWGLMSIGGMDIGSRLLNEGVALIDEASFQRLPMPVQQQMITAEEQARQFQRGIWRHQQSRVQQRFHYPLWPADRLPSPLTNAPVYQPE